MNEFLLIGGLSALLYFIAAVGIMRPVYLHEYKSFRTPKNGTQMEVMDAKREAAKSAAGWAFAWPFVLMAACIFLPLALIFDVVPAVGRATGRAVVAGVNTAGPVVGAPLVKWVSAPVEREVAAEAQLALEARAAAGAEPEEPLIPDSISGWVPPKDRPTDAERLIRDRLALERDQMRIEVDNPYTVSDRRSSAVRKPRRSGSGRDYIIERGEEF